MSDVDGMRLWAVRGAIAVEANESPAILEATDALVRALLERNTLEPDRIVSCIFTCTADLDADFPAKAARTIGLDQVPLLCAKEIPVPGAMPSVIRVLVHYYATPAHRPAHAYLRGAEALRSDLHAAQ